MAPATARLILAAWLFFLPVLSLLHHHVSATGPPVSFSFDFSNTSNSLEDLQFEGDALRVGDLVDLTCDPMEYNCVGRMSYKHPFVLYDNITGELASFTTSFTFSILMAPNTSNGDGMAFFLSGYPSKLPPGSNHDMLGLASKFTTTPSGPDRFLAVEFDTFNNTWDPTESSNHMGIDLNNLTSVVTTILPSYSLNGTMTATITLDNTTRTLEATLHFDDSDSLDDAQVKTQLPDDLDALLPPEVAVGFSASTGANAERHQIHSWSFNSTMAARETPPGATNVDPERGQVLETKDGRGRELIIGGAVLLALALLLVIWSTMSWYRWKRTRDSFGMGSQVKRYEYRDLAMATSQFSVTIGAGGFGVVYRGSLNSMDIAVKEILKDSRGESKDFLAELGAISQTRHSNIVRLEGWCCSINNFMFWCFHRSHNMIKLFLVYELVPNGNLHQHLYDNANVLPWAMRFKIVKGLCCALQYLHHECTKYILHRDIKPSNILLDDEFNAKLGNFGLSRVAQDVLETSLQTMAVGTARYMDPLCLIDGHVNFRRSSDVYSFGIVLLEIVHGKYDADLFLNLHTDRPDTFVEDFADEKLAGQFDKAQMERVILLGLRCSEQVARRRPSLNGATLQFLERGGELRPATIHEDESSHPATPHHSGS